jgi:hypothetical protein
MMDFGERERFAEVSRRALVFQNVFRDVYQTFTSLIFRQKSAMISIEFVA